MAIDYIISVSGMTVHPKNGREPGGAIVTFKVDQEGMSVDPRLPKSFEIPVTLMAGVFADESVIEVTQARLAFMAEALARATAGWKRDEAWFDERRLPKATS